MGGNCHDYLSPSGVRVQTYGPHYFRTDQAALVDYLSGFTRWTPGFYEARSRVRGQLLPFPINLDTLEGFFDRKFADATEARGFLASLPEVSEAAKNSAQNLEDRVVAELGRELFQAFYAGYTRKQWGRDASELAASLATRTAVRWDRDPGYVRAAHQMMPADGFTALFDNLLRDPRIEVRRNVDFREARTAIRPRVATIYTGALDEYFDARLGRLPWRSLRFEFTETPGGLQQPCAQINEPDAAVPWTRSVEYRHITRAEASSTVVSREFPQSTGDPYYPEPSAEAERLAARYRELADQETREHRVYFEGRLARFAYLNMDQAFEAALRLWDRVAVDHLRAGGSG